MNNWLQELKVGDNVIVSGGWSESIGKVERLTNTQILLNSGSRYRKEDGWLIGANNHPFWLIEPTEQKLDNIYRLNAAKKLEVIKWKALPLEKLREILKMAQDPIG